jgi:transposase-like protein
MSRPKGKINAVCQNKDCGFYRRENGKDIVKRGHNTAGHQRYYCKYLVETKGTPLYQRKISERKIKSICKELVEKKGVRAISRTHHINKNTVCSLLDDLANHALQMSKYLVHDLDFETYEVDEILTMVKKNKKNLSRKQIASLDLARRQLQLA